MYKIYTILYRIFIYNAVAGHYISQHESLINHRIIDTRTHMLTHNRSVANTDISFNGIRLC